MKKKQDGMTADRQKELIHINRVLAVLVVVLALTSGLLLAWREELFSQKSPRQLVAPEITLATSSGSLVVIKPPASTLTSLLEAARYNRVLEKTAISQKSLFKLLWAAQGKITSWGERTVPSYKSTYPITLTVLARAVEKTPAGWYRYSAEEQILDVTTDLSSTLSVPDTYPGLINAPVVIVASVPTDLAAERMVWNEAGGIAQNILLSAVDEELSTFLLPAFGLPPELVSQLTSPNETVLWVMPVGQATEEKGGSTE